MTEEKITLPNLIIIGAMKCGSTSLHAYLDMHPDIQMSDPKELNFFSKEENYKKGISWYHTFFKEGYKYNGESSINYSKRQVFSQVASRMKETLSEDLKIIYIVREPIDRFQSNFTDSKTYGDIDSSYSINAFIEDKSENNPLLKTSMYFYQIEPYIAEFDLKNMYFLKAEDLKKEPQNTMNKLFEFLELDSISIEKKTLNQSSSKTYYSSRFLKLTQSPIFKSIKLIIPNQLIDSLKNSHTLNKLSKKEINPDLDLISENNRAVLKKYLSEDMSKFEALTNIKF